MYGWIQKAGHLLSRDYLCRFCIGEKTRTKNPITNAKLRHLIRTVIQNLLEFSDHFFICQTKFHFNTP